MLPQISCPNWGELTEAAFVWFFSRMFFEMFSQIACLSRCIFTLVAFVWFFSRVSFYMLLQAKCMSRWKLTLVAFVRFLSRVSFHMVFQSACYDCCDTHTFPKYRWSHHNSQEDDWQLRCNRFETDGVSGKVCWSHCGLHSGPTCSSLVRTLQGNRGLAKKMLRYVISYNTGSTVKHKS